MRIGAFWRSPRVMLAKRLGKEEEEAEQAAGLEPPFPYVMARFDVEFFEL